MQKTILSGVLVALAASMTIQDVQAEPSAARKALQARSAVSGLNGTRIPILKRKAGEGNSVVASRLAQRLQVRLGIKAGYTLETQPRKLLLKGPDWTIEASDLGNALRFRGPVSAVTVPSNAKPSAAQIEASARAFLTDVASDFVKLGRDEELVFLGTKYAHNSGQAAGAAQPDASTVSEWVGIFGRRIGGELVIGGGSIAAVLFNADGSVQGFDRDWPEYEASGAAADVLDASAIKSRGNSLRLQAAGDVESRFECGYFDPGGRKRSAQKLIQPACLQSILSTAGSVNHGTVYAIPASRVPLKSTAWPELDAVCKRGGSCQAETQ